MENKIITLTMMLIIGIGIGIFIVLNCPPKIVKETCSLNELKVGNQYQVNSDNYFLSDFNRYETRIDLYFDKKSGK